MFGRQPRLKSVPPGDYTDLHVHILPDVDDGPPDVDAAAALVEGLSGLGFSRFVVTPHQYASHFPRATEARIREALERVNRRLEQDNSPATLALGAEHMYDAELPQRIENQQVVRMAGSRYLLIEFANSFVPSRLPQILFELRVKGVTPILAHPERWGRLMEQPALVERIVEAQSALLQIDLPSLGGKHGRRVKKHAVQLLKRDQAHLLSSDAHSVRDLPAVMKGLLSARKILGDEGFARLAVENSRAIWDDRPLFL